MSGQTVEGERKFANWRAAVSDLEPDEWWVLADDEDGHPHIIGRDIDEKTARLIAAATTMYEALQDIVEQFEWSRMPISPDLADSIRVFGKQALALAEKGIE